MSSDKFASVVYEHRLSVVVLVVAISAAALWAATRVTFDNSIEIWFLEDDPDVVVYNDFAQRFHADEIVVIGVFAEDVFAPSTWSAIEEMTAAAEQVPYAHRVMSMTNIGVLDPYPGPGGPTLSEQALANSLLSGNFVSPDGRTAAIVAYLAREGNSFDKKKAFVEALRAIGSDITFSPPATIRMSGTPVIDDAAMRNSERDLAVIVPIMIAVIFGFTLIIFRRFVHALLPLLVVLMSVLWAYGLMGVLGLKTTLLSTLLTPLLLAVGVADSIHVISRYVRHLRLGDRHADAVKNSLAGLLTPCFFTSATTAAALMSLLVSDIQPVREFGLIAAAGVMAAFSISILFIPATLAMLRAPPNEYLERQRQSSLARLLTRIGSSSRFTLVTVIGSGFVLVLFAWQALRIDVGVDPMSWFPEDAPVRQDTEHIDKALGGSISLEFLVRTDPGALRDPRVLDQLDNFERWLENNTSITGVLSLVDVLKELGRAGQADEGAEPQLPESDALGVLLDGMDRQGANEQWVHADYSVGRLSARIPLSRATQMIDEMPIIEAEMAKRFSTAALSMQTTGYAKLMVRMEEHVIDSQINSLLLAFLTVSALMILLLRSWRLAVFAMIPNLVPVLIGLGFMTILGIGLNPGTVMIGAIALGVVVDDTVHFLTAFRSRLEQGDDVDTGIRNTIEEVGRPIVVTSILLATSFATLLLGQFVPSMQVGLITTIVVITALLADLILLPAVLRTLPRSLIVATQA